MTEKSPRSKEIGKKRVSSNDDKKERADTLRNKSL